MMEWDFIVMEWEFIVMEWDFSDGMGFYSD